MFSYNLFRILPMLEGWLFYPEKESTLKALTYFCDYWDKAFIWQVHIFALFLSFDFLTNLKTKYLNPELKIRKLLSEITFYLKEVWKLVLITVIVKLEKLDCIASSQCLYPKKQMSTICLTNVKAVSGCVGIWISSFSREQFCWY